MFTGGDYGLMIINQTPNCPTPDSDFIDNIIVRFESEPEKIKLVSIGDYTLDDDLYKSENSDNSFLMFIHNDTHGEYHIYLREINSGVPCYTYVLKKDGEILNLTTAEYNIIRQTKSQRLCSEVPEFVMGEGRILDCRDQNPIPVGRCYIDWNTYNCEWQTTQAPTTLSPTTLSPTTLSPTTLAPSTLSPTTLSPTTLAPSTPTPQVYNNVKIKVYTSRRYMYIESNIGNLNNKSISINGSEPIKIECSRGWWFSYCNRKRLGNRWTGWFGIKYYPKDQNNNYYISYRTHEGMRGGSARAFNYDSTDIRTVNITVYN